MGTNEFATPRLAAGALFVSHGRVLLVRKTYGNRWDIPGGYVNPGESPASACERELFEELGLVRNVRHLLVHDWAPSAAEGDKILYVFDCGELGTDERNIKVDGKEIEGTKWVEVGDLAGYLIPRLARRLAHAYQACLRRVTMYLENGVDMF